MNINEIDEIIIKGLIESERRNETFADTAKPRVWEAIEKPKERKTLNWWFVSAMAAAISMFLISTILFLKLESQKEELLALKTYVSNEFSPIESTYEMVLPAEEQIIEKKPRVIQESIPIVENEKTISKVNNFESEVDEGIEVSDPIIPEPNLTMIILPKVDIDIPELFHQELKTQLVQGPEVNNQIFTEPKSIKQRKLKFKFGNGNNAQDYSNTYALNIKL